MCCQILSNILNCLRQLLCNVINLILWSSNQSITVVANGLVAKWSSATIVMTLYKAGWQMLEEFWWNRCKHVNITHFSLSNYRIQQSNAYISILVFNETHVKSSFHLCIMSYFVCLFTWIKMIYTSQKTITNPKGNRNTSIVQQTIAQGGVSLQVTKLS